MQQRMIHPIMLLKIWRKRVFVDEINQQHQENQNAGLSPTLERPNVDCEHVAKLHYLIQNRCLLFYWHLILGAEIPGLDILYSWAQSLHWISVS